MVINQTEWEKGCGTYIPAGNINGRYCIINKKKQEKYDHEIVLSNDRCQVIADLMKMIRTGIVFPVYIISFLQYCFLFSFHNIPSSHA